MGTAVDLHPPAVDFAPHTVASQVYGIHGMQQVGEVQNQQNMTTMTTAVLWNGTSESVVYLGYRSALSSLYYSVAVATDGFHQVGYGSCTSTDFGAKHAIAWSGTAASVVDIHPTQFKDSYAVSVAGSHIVGNGTLNSPYDLRHALLWTGMTPNSAVDLHPTKLPGFVSSFANDTNGSQQLGAAGMDMYDSFSSGVYYFTGSEHAMLWTGTADSAVDLHPSGFAASDALATNGSIQVGWGLTDIGTYQALAWSGTADSAVNLQALLPPGLSMGSCAESVDSQGDVFGIVWDASYNYHAVEWVAVPEPSGLFLSCLGALGAFTWRRKNFKTVGLC